MNVLRFVRYINRIKDKINIIKYLMHLNFFIEISSVLGKPVYNDADHIQLDPSDSSSDTVDTVASSANGNGSEELSESSGYHGSNSSRSASSR